MGFVARNPMDRVEPRPRIPPNRILPASRKQRLSSTKRDKRTQRAAQAWTTTTIDHKKAKRALFDDIAMTARPLGADRKGDPFGQPRQHRNRTSSTGPVAHVRASYVRRQREPPQDHPRRVRTPGSRTLFARELSASSAHKASPGSPRLLLQPAIVA